MKHRIDVFSPETYQWFSASDRQLAGVKARYRMLASEVGPGDLLIGYVTRRGSLVTVHRSRSGVRSHRLTGRRDRSVPGARLVMPMYLVRWPGLVAALMTAADEDDLIGILDETANREGCTWSVYRGSVYVEVSLNAELEIGVPEANARELRGRPIEPSEIRLGEG